MLIGTKKHFIILTSAENALKTEFFSDEIADIMADWKEMGMSEVVGL